MKTSRPSTILNIPRPDNGVRQHVVLSHLAERFPGGIPQEIVYKAAMAQMHGTQLTVALADQWADAVKSTEPLAAKTPTYRTGYETRTSIVYYLRFGNLVKIGTTTNLPQRMQAIPHDELLATEPGNARLEHSRHSQFKNLRHKGEWFRYEEPLTTFIAKLAAA